MAKNLPSGVTKNGKTRHTWYVAQWIRGFSGEKIYGVGDQPYDDSGCGIILDRRLEPSEYDDFPKCRRCYAGN